MADSSSTKALCSFAVTLHWWTDPKETPRLFFGRAETHAQSSYTNMTQISYSTRRVLLHDSRDFATQLYTSSISASPDGMSIVWGYGCARTQNDRPSEAVVLSTSTPIPHATDLPAAMLIYSYGLAESAPTKCGT